MSEEAEHDRAATTAMADHDRAPALIDGIAARERAAIDAAAQVDADRQDADYHAVALRIRFSVAQAGNGWTALEDTSDPAEWGEFCLSDAGSDDGPPLGELVASIVLDQVKKTLAPWASHFVALGLPRADSLDASVMGTEDRAGVMTFYLVSTAAGENAGPAWGTLSDFPTITTLLKGTPGLSLDMSGDHTPVNASRLYEAMRDAEPGVGSWGGDATPALYPELGEKRGDWLARVCMPAAKLTRLAERWRRSGGDLTLFGVFGSASERAVEERPIEFAIPGLFPLGYVSLLVGTKQSGKSTLLGEAAAVIDSECLHKRTFLGTQVLARGVSGIVSGEDGDDFYNARAAYYEQVHGSPQGFMFDIARHPWQEVLSLLQGVPELVFLGIDPLRCILPGDEDASSAISQLFDQLNALARAKNCAVVLVHHLGKHPPKSLSAMLPAVRGSSAITDRPRQVVGMIDRGNSITEVGIIKNNLPPCETLWGEVNVGRLFRRDATTLTLVPVENSRNEPAFQQAEPETKSLILAAIGHENMSRAILRRTGKSELFERKAPQLAAISRLTLREAVTALLASGDLSDGAGGLQVASPKMADGRAV